MTSMLRTVGGTPSTTTPPPNPTISMSRAFGRAITASGDSQYSPLNRCSDPGLSISASGRPLVRKRQAAVLRQHDDARAAADVVIEHAALVADVERRGHQQGHRRLRPEEHATGDRQHGLARWRATRFTGSSTHTRRRPARRWRTRRRESRLRIAARESAGIPRPASPTMAPTVFHAYTRALAGAASSASLRQHAHGQWIGHADGEGHGQQQQAGRTARWARAGSRSGCPMTRSRPAVDGSSARGVDRPPRRRRRRRSARRPAPARRARALRASRAPSAPPSAMPARKLATMTPNA